jgi:hypothetical protein
VSCWWNHLQIVGASEHELSLRDHQWAARSQGGGLLLQCVGWGCSQLLTKLQFLYSKVWFFFSPPPGLLNRAFGYCLQCVFCCCCLFVCLCVCVCVCVCVYFLSYLQVVHSFHLVIFLMFGLVFSCVKEWGRVKAIWKDQQVESKTH